MKFENVMYALKCGRPVTRKHWNNEVYFRYDDFNEVFVMHVGEDEPKGLQGLTLDPESMFADDWMWGEWHPVKDEITWIQKRS